jgi:hypothetical protein
MPNADKPFVKLQALFITCLFICFGVVLLLLSEQATIAHPTWQVILRELGALMLVTASVSFLWEFFAKLALLKDVIELVELSENIEASGINSVYQKFYEEPPWADLFEDATEVDLHVSYARTWRASQRTRLRDLSKRKCHIRLLMANPESDDLVKELSRRHATTPVEMRKLITESQAEFCDLLGKGLATYELFLTDRAVLYTYYRFNDSIVVACGANSDAKADRPAFLLTRPGVLTAFVKEDFESCLRMAKRCALAGAPAQPAANANP